MKYFLSALLMFSYTVLAQSPEPAPSMAQFNQAAEQCQDLKCVRDNIDAVDSQIVTLLGQRLAYVKRAGELKGPDISVRDRSREAAIMSKVTAEAQAVGYSPFVARSVFTTILLQSTVYEQQFHK